MTDVDQTGEPSARRVYSTDYKVAILAEYGRLDAAGRAALRRREDLSSNLIWSWQQGRTRTSRQRRQFSTQDKYDLLDEYDRLRGAARREFMARNGLYKSLLALWRRHRREGRLVGRPTTPSPPLPPATAGRRHMSADAIAADLHSMIESGRYQPGAKLPPYRLIAQVYAVSTSTAARVVAMLREAGLVEGAQGRGVYVSDPGRGTTALPRPQPGRRRYWYSRDEDAEIRRRHEAGEGIPQIATALGRDPASVQYRVQALRLSRPPGLPQVAIDATAVLALYNNGRGKTIRAIAAELGCSYGGVWRVIDKAEAPRRLSWSRRQRPPQPASAPERGVDEVYRSMVEGGAASRSDSGTVQ